MFRFKRLLEKYGKIDSPLYTRLATEYLLQLDDNNDMTKIRKTKKNVRNYDNRTSTEHIKYRDSQAKFISLYNILYKKGNRYKLFKRNAAWMCSRDYIP